MRCLFVFAVLISALAPAYSQVSSTTCNVSAGIPPLIRAGGEAELVSDVVMVCSTSGAPASALVNIHIFLNTNLTSRITNTVTMATEALLLIDDPQPGLPNLSNGFPYLGQVLGTPGVLAGNPGSGNVYQGTVAADNSVVFAGVPFVTGVSRTFRITSIRANTTPFGGSGTILSDIAVSGTVSVTIPTPVSTVGIIQNGLNFSSSLLGSVPGLDLHFDEVFPSAFKKRIENTNLGPLTAVHQDIPGTFYCTESGFNPEFSAVTPDAIGSATTGTRLHAKIANLPSAVFLLIVPNQVTSTTGNLVAHRVLPPFAANFTGGTVTTSGGDSLAFVSGHSADLLYEVTASAPFNGKNGCFSLDGFNIAAIPFFPVPVGSAIVTGHLAPVDSTGKASATAPAPRFQP